MQYVLIIMENIEQSFRQEMTVCRNLTKWGVNMTKELYDELREIEDRIYNIAKENGDIFNSELGDIWSALYSYLETVEVNDLE